MVWFWAQAEQLALFDLFLIWTGAYNSLGKLVGKLTFSTWRRLEMIFVRNELSEDVLFSLELKKCQWLLFNFLLPSSRVPNFNPLNHSSSFSISRLRWSWQFSVWILIKSSCALLHTSLCSTQQHLNEVIVPCGPTGLYSVVWANTVI